MILEGPGAGGEETATAVIGDLLAVIGTSGTGFLQHDGYYRELHRLPLDELQSPFYLRFEVDDEPGVLAQVAQALADQACRWRRSCSTRARACTSSSSPTAPARARCAPRPGPSPRSASAALRL